MLTEGLLEQLQDADRNIWEDVNAIVDAYNRLQTIPLAGSRGRINPAWFSAVDNRDHAIARLAKRMPWRHAIVAAEWR